MIDRRTFFGGVVGGFLATPFATSFAAEMRQAGKVYRIGYLSTPTRESVERGVDAFLRKLRELGWVDGQNLVIEYRWAEGNVELLPELAADLVRRKVDLIVAPAGSAALAAKTATGSIPIVMIFPSDPVETGLVASLSRPGGNITGTTFTAGPEIFGKQLQILKETIPRAALVAVLSNPADPSFALQVEHVGAAARSLGIRLQHVDARGSEGFEAAFAAMARERADALLVTGSSTFLAHRARLAELAMMGRLPTMLSFRESVEAGGLMAYAVNMADFVGRAATYVDKILKGAKPADLPVEQPTKFELIINLKTAKALGIAVPRSLLLRANEVIQ
ncbi:ABC transporter substrate-binding protein [Variovorax sp. M-6]|uniref:ABC transporter substrate-binding protein n=1 Tax=Variovorax sp. M-6 TaxID=3233041 RepID=UPI003F97A0C5